MARKTVTTSLDTELVKKLKYLAADTEKQLFEEFAQVIDHWIFPFDQLPNIDFKVVVK